MYLLAGSCYTNKIAGNSKFKNKIFCNPTATQILGNDTLTYITFSFVYYSYIYKSTLMFNVLHSNPFSISSKSIPLVTYLHIYTTNKITNPEPLRGIEASRIFPLQILYSVNAFFHLCIQSFLIQSRLS